MKSADSQLWLFQAKLARAISKVFLETTVSQPGSRIVA